MAAQATFRADRGCTTPVKDLVIVQELTLTRSELGECRALYAGQTGLRCSNRRRICVKDRVRAEIFDGPTDKRRMERVKGRFETVEFDDAIC